MNGINGRRLNPTVIIAIVGLLSTVVSGYVAISLAQIQRTTEKTADAVAGVEHEVNSKNQALVEKVQELNDLIASMAKEKGAVDERVRAAESAVP